MPGSALGIEGAAGAEGPPPAIAAGTAAGDAAGEAIIAEPIFCIICPAAF
jgi:hypothetical protein